MTGVLEENFGVSSGKAILTVNVIIPLHNGVRLPGR